MRKHFLLLFFSQLMSLANLTKCFAQEGSVLEFDNTFTLKFSLKYNFMQFSQEGSPNDKILTNRPLDFGIGFAYKDFSLGFSVNIPFLYNQNILKTYSLDFGFTYFLENIMYFDGFFKYYDGFHAKKYAVNEEEIDMRLISAGFSGEYIFNREHLLRSVYNLDKKQLKSNGSFLAGGGIFYTSASSEDIAITEYSKQNAIVYFGPDFGYSFIWIMKENYFLNILTVFGINATTSDEKMYFGFQILPKFSFGYHGKSWSLNMAIGNNSLIYLRESELGYIINNGNFTITFAKRI